MKNWLRKWLGVQAVEERQNKQDERLADMARHFVTKRGSDGKIAETLADQHADADGKPRPVIRHGRNWDQTRRILEANDAAQALARRAHRPK